MEPPLPPGRYVELPRRGTTFVRELAGPPGAPVLLLLHGWTASSDLNWFATYDALGRRHRVVALDHRGHGRGIRSPRWFRLDDCADDAVALLDVLGIDRAVVVGYSMGGAVAQLVWQRHRERVAALVLCATCRAFAQTPLERQRLAVLGAVALGSRAVPQRLAGDAIHRVMTARSTAQPLSEWAVEELRRNDWTTVLEAGRALSRFDSRSWIGGVDVPAAVVVPMRDQLVPPRRQLAMARAIPGATLHPVQGDHTICSTAPERFVPALLDACESVTT